MMIERGQNARRARRWAARSRSRYELRSPTFGDRIDRDAAVGRSDSMNTVNLAEKLATFTEHWQPRTVGQFNGHDLMVVKVKGEFVWHKHDDTDDFFLVLKGRLVIRLRDRTVTLYPGELFVVPRGVEHCPVAEEETHMLLIETTGTPNTGEAATAAPRRVI
jgi:mannose-6-phosphate isomerase-like protein (cupin superfamily)